MAEVTYSDIKKIVGETLAYVDVDPEGDHILLTTVSGRQFSIFHRQDCCESVRIQGLDGEWSELFGKVIQEAKHEEEDLQETYESGTLTALTFKVDGATVVSRWIGESNGYYSECVNVDELQGRSKKKRPVE
jgi:hypothetical protein